MNKKSEIVSLFELSVDPHKKDNQINIPKDLNTFKQHLNDNQKNYIHTPYSSRKKSIAAYRLTFFCFGALFTLLSLLVHFKTQANYTHVIFGSFSTFKNLVLATSSFLALSSFILGLTLHTEKEVAKHYVKKAQNNLGLIYSRKRIQLGVSLLGQNKVKSTLKQLYRDAVNKTEELEDEAIILMEHISESDTIDLSQKEKLFNQAIAELKAKLENIVCLFRNTDISRLS